MAVAAEGQRCKRGPGPRVADLVMDPIGRMQEDVAGERCNLYSCSFED